MPINNKNLCQSKYSHESGNNKALNAFNIYVITVRSKIMINRVWYDVFGVDET